MASSMPSPRPDEGFFQPPTPLRDQDSVLSQPIALGQPSRQRLAGQLKQIHSVVPLRTSSIAKSSDKRSPARPWSARPRSDRPPERPYHGGVNDENVSPVSERGLGPMRRDSEVTLGPSPSSSKLQLQGMGSEGTDFAVAAFGHTTSANTDNIGATMASGHLQSPVQHRPASKRTFNQWQQREPGGPGTPPIWPTPGLFASLDQNNSTLSNLSIADVTNSGQGGCIFTSAGSDLGIFPDQLHAIQPIPTVAQLATARQGPNGQALLPGQTFALVNPPAARQRQQQQLQQPPQLLGQPFQALMGGDLVVRNTKSLKKNRRSSDIGLCIASSVPSSSAAPASSSSSSSTSSSSSSAASSLAAPGILTARTNGVESTDARMRMPSHTSLLLGLSLGPAFGDEDSATQSSTVLLQSQLAEAPQVAGSGAGVDGGAGKRAGGGKNGGEQSKKKKGGSGGRGASIERGKITKAARLPLGGSPSFGLNIMGLGDALEIDSSYIYLEKDANCRSPVPCIVITPPAVVVAHTPSRLARSESKTTALFAMAMTALTSEAKMPGGSGTLAPAPVSTDSPSVRSISTTGASSSATVRTASTETPPSGESQMISSPSGSLSSPPTARAGCAPGEWGRGGLSFESPPETLDPSVMSIIQQRMSDDQSSFTELALEIDVILSEYIYINSPTQAWIVGRRLTTLLLNAIHGTGLGKVPPSLRKVRQVGEELLPADWVQTESERLREKVLDHVVTGILVVLADPRSPFETPQSLAQLCCSLRISLSAPQQGHTLDVEIPCLSPYGGIASGQPSPPVEPRTSRDLGVLFEEIVFANLRDILQKGEDVRDRAHRLEVPLARKGNKKRWEMASSERIRASADQQKNRKLAAKGIISGDEFLKLERRRAARGTARDQFADISVLRFTGELFQVSFIGLADVQAWLERMLFDTIYPGVPSVYELGCACALITIVGPQLEAMADKVDRRSQMMASSIQVAVPRLSQPPPGRRVPETPSRQSDEAKVGITSQQRPLRPDAPANHWIQYSPAAAIRSPPSPFSSTSTRTISCRSGKLSLSSFGSLHSVQSSCSSNWSGGSSSGFAALLSPPPSAKAEGNEARLTVVGCMERLEELLRQDDFEDPVKEIIKSVLGLYSRGWVASTTPFTPTRVAAN